MSGFDEWYRANDLGLDALFEAHGFVAALRRAHDAGREEGRRVGREEGRREVLSLPLKELGRARNKDSYLREGDEVVLESRAGGGRPGVVLPSPGADPTTTIGWGEGGPIADLHATTTAPIPPPEADDFSKRLENNLLSTGLFGEEDTDG